MESCRKTDEEYSTLPEPNQGESIDNYLISSDENGSFQRLIGGKDKDYFSSVCQTQDGNFVFCGGSSESILVLKTNTSGETIWLKTFSDQLTANGIDIKETNDNGFIIAAGSSPEPSSGMVPSSNSGLLLKLDQDGELQWKKSFNPGPITSFSGVERAANGGFIVSGTEYSTLGGFLLGVDENGSEVWSQVIVDGSEFREVELTSDGSILVCGRKSLYSEGEKDDNVIVKTTDAGEIIWTKIDGDQYRNRAIGVAETNDGYLVCGENYKTPSSSLGYLRKLDVNGKNIWSSEYDGISSFNFISMNDSESIITTGTNDNVKNEMGILAEISSTDGVLLWQRSFHPGSNNRLLMVHPIAEGGYIIAGSSIDQFNNQNAYIIRIDKQGN